MQCLVGNRQMPPIFRLQHMLESGWVSIVHMYSAWHVQCMACEQRVEKVQLAYRHSAGKP